MCLLIFLFQIKTEKLKYFYKKLKTAKYTRFLCSVHFLASSKMSTSAEEDDVLMMTCETAKEIAKTSEATVFSLIFVGIVINATVCGVMLRNKCVLKNLSNFFVFHLSVADLIFRLLTVGPLIYLSTVFSTEKSGVPCKLYHFFSSTCGASFFVTLVVIAVDVYRDAASPLKGLMSRRTPFLVVLGVWLYAAVCSGPLMYSAQSVLYTEIPEVWPNVTDEFKNCSVPKLCDFYRNWSGQLSTTLYFVLAFLVPLVVMVILFLLTYVYLRRDYKNGTISKETATAKGKVTRMLSALSLGVVICWGPVVLISMLRSYDGLAGVSPDIVLILTIFTELLKFMNSLFNPLIFACYIPNFRRDLFGLCKDCKCCRSAKEVENPSLRRRHMIQSTEYRDSQTMM